MLRIAEIPYLNCAPFYWNKNLENGNIQWIAASPKKLGELAKQGEIDAGPLSLVDSFQLEPAFEPLGAFGIAVAGSVKSVLLFSKDPIQNLQGKKIGLTLESVTSIKLLELILEKKYQLQVTYNDGFSNSDAAQLYIGDLAFEKLAQFHSQRLKNFSHVTDLAEEWVQWQKLPFVFARWMVRKELSSKNKTLIQSWLTCNLEQWQKENGTVLKQFEAQTNRLYPEGLRYLQHFHYALNPKDTQAIQTFRNLL